VEAKILDAVSGGLSDLRGQGLAMNQELDRQMDKIDALGVDVDIAVRRLYKDNRAIKELM